MMRSRKLFALFALALLALEASRAGAGGAPPPAAAWTPTIPRAWDPAALESMEVPFVNPDYVARYVVDADFYYRIPVRPIYKSYPVYHPGQEPAGYLVMLRQQEPEIAFDPERLKTEEDWIRAGEIVFDAPILYGGQGRIDELHDPAWYEKLAMPVAKDGTVPFFRYVIREKGKIEVARFSCGMCHTRVLPDGRIVKGAQGNFPHERLQALDKERDAAREPDAEKLLQFLRGFGRNAFAAPWIADDPAARYARLTAPEIIAAHAAIPPGVQARFAASVFDPVQVPDLIGIKDRLYLDHTGLVRHRSAADVMRYAILNQGGFLFAAHGDFKFNQKLPEPEKMLRYSDEQLYALALWLYSLPPPENPNKPDALSARGQQVFKRESCDRCHMPPLYTSNKLVPVDGVLVTRAHPDYAHVHNYPVDTDEGLALRTRRGTGLYKIPSLKGLWYRGPLEHSGRVATLEEWFDPRRLRPDFVSKGGFRPPGAASGAVRGHEFGLKLTEEDRKALIAFLRTL